MKQMTPIERILTILSILLILIAASCSLSAEVIRVGNIQYQQKNSKVYSSVIRTNITFKSGYELNHQFYTKQYIIDRIYVIIHWNNTINYVIAKIDGYVSPYPFVLKHDYLNPYHYFIGIDRQGNKWLIDTH